MFWTRKHSRDITNKGGLGMKRKIFIMVMAFCVLGLAAYAGAATYSYDFTYDGTFMTTNTSAAGNNIVIGDQVEVAFNAAGTGYWSLNAGQSIWEPINVNPDSATRTGDLYWTFYLDGVAVDSGFQLDQQSSMVHFPQHVTASKTINFDRLYWIYTLDNSTGTENVLQGLIFGSSADLSPAVYHVGAATVPEPLTILLLGLGLLGVAVTRRTT